MPDYAAPLQRLVLSRTLWLVVIWPLVGLAWQVLVARRRIADARGQSAMRRALASTRNAGIACVALAVSSTFAHAVVLSHAPEGGGALLQHLSAGVRFGQLDAEVDLLFDRLSATFCTLACLIALAVAAVLAGGPPPNRGWRPWAWLQLSLAGALVTFVADGFVGTAIGWAMAGAAGAWLAGWNDLRAWLMAAMRSAIAMTSMFLGAIFLFWGLGGSWDGDNYAPDTPARFATTRAAGWSGHGTEDVASLSLTNVADAEVFIDDARTPAARSPFVDLPVPPGTHALRVRTGGGSNEDILGRVVFEAGAEPVVLVPLGPTLAFRAIADQLLLFDRVNDTSAKRALELRTGPGGAAIVAASLVALLLGAGLMSGTPPSLGSPLPLGALAYGATSAAVGPYLLARLAFLFSLAPNTWIAIESVGAVILLAAGWRAPAGAGVGRWLAFAGAAPAALAFLALGASGVAATSAVLTVSGAATAALFLVTARRKGFERAGDPEELDRVAIGHGSVQELLLVRIPARLGSLLVSMERWVVGATASALAAVAGAGAWLTATMDEHWIASPANAIATRVVRVERGLEPTLGGSAVRLAWALLAGAGLLLLAHVLFQGG